MPLVPSCWTGPARLCRALRRYSMTRRATRDDHEGPPETRRKRAVMGPPRQGLGSPSMRALVVGGTGPTGPYVVNGLVERGYEVAILHSGRHEVDSIPP